VLVSLIEKLLAYNPICDNKESNKFAKVSPSGIGIITSYKGQQRLIKDYLKASNIGPGRVNEIRKSHYDAFRSLVVHMYSRNDIVSSSDIDAALLSEPAQAQRPTTSKFYKQVPTIPSAKRKSPPSASHRHQEVRGDKKSETAFEMRQLQKEVPTVSNPPSKRQAQLAVKTARRAEREKAAAAAAEGSAGHLSRRPPLSPRATSAYEVES
jgi:hypothetical protein